MQKHSRNYILPRNSHLVITSTQNRVITVSTGTFRGHNSDDTGGRLSPQKAKWGHDCYLLSHVRLFATPWTAALPGSSVHGDSPGKDTGLGCHFLLQGIFPTQGLKLYVLHGWANALPLTHLKSVVAQSCPTLCDPTDCSLPGSSVHGMLQAGILEWAAMPSSGGSSPPGDRTRVSHVSCIGGRVPYH